MQTANVEWRQEVYRVNDDVDKRQRNEEENCIKRRRRRGERRRRRRCVFTTRGFFFIIRYTSTTMFWRWAAHSINSNRTVQSRFYFNFVFIHLVHSIRGTPHNPLNVSRNGFLHFFFLSEIIIFVVEKLYDETIVLYTIINVFIDGRVRAR